MREGYEGPSATLAPTSQQIPVHHHDDIRDDALIRLAIDKNVDVDKLERLIALKEREVARNARDAFFQALANFQEKCPPVVKNKTAEIVSRRTGGKFSYGYASLDELQRHIRPYLRAENLSYSFDVEADGKERLIVTCILRHIDGHFERASFPVPIETTERMSGAQANGAALSYGKRQALSAVLGLSIEEDTDGKRADAPDLITEEQAADIDALIDEVYGPRRERFMKWLKVDTVAEIKAADYRRAVSELERMRDA